MVTLAPMLEQVTPAVVNVNTQTRVRMRSPFANDPFFQHFFGIPDWPQERIERSLGSGVIVDAQKGYVLTNNHVVDRADDIQVTLADGRTLKAKKVGADPDSDVAVIQIQAQRLVALPLADSNQLRVGDFVVAVGNPFGLGQTATSGIVSALGRTAFKGLGVQNFIQTDASINPGNSGGALVNLRGELIGINTAIFSPSGGNVGIGFAIPSSLAKQVMQQLLLYGEVKRGSLGVHAQNLNEDISKLLNTSQAGGVAVTRVLPDSPAAAAGIRVGDVLTTLHGNTITDVAGLRNAEALLPLDMPIALSFLRDGKRQTVSVVLKPAVTRRQAGAALDPRLTGADLSDAPPNARTSAGVLVTAVATHSRAAANGLRAGDRIVQINQRDTADLSDLESALAAKPQQVLLTIVRGQQGFFALLE